MAKRTRIGTAALDARAALAIGRGTWRLRSGRLPWQSGRAVRRRRRDRARRLRRMTLFGR